MTDTMIDIHAPLKELQQLLTEVKPTYKEIFDDISAYPCSDTILADIKKRQEAEKKVKRLTPYINS